MKRLFQENATPKFRNLILLFATLLLSISCDKIISTASPDEDTAKGTAVETSSSDNIHVAFAGGGWRAHTGHTAWTMSLLETNGNKLDNVFQHVESIGSNSGGSWFSTMLIYSPKFVTNIETIALKNWGDTMNGGWLGGQQNLFNDISHCSSASGEAYSACVISYYSGIHLEWNEVVKSLVFKDYFLNGKTLNGSRQSWANDKSLFLASTMLTNNVVLNAAGGVSGRGYNQFYQACYNSTANTHGKNGGSCSSGVVPDVTPVIFSSSAQSTNSNLTMPPFFPEAGASTQFNIAYSQQTDNNPNTGNASIANPINNDQVEVLHAAAASSAAVGFAASENASGGWDFSYAADNSALNFSLKNGIATYDVAQDGTSISDLASSISVSFADGGAVDNSGVAQIVNFLQANGDDTDFHIVAFDNVQSPPFHIGAGPTLAEAGNDIASLFGYGLCEGNTFCSGFNCGGTCVAVPELQVFESKTLTSTPVTWSYPAKPSKYMNTPKLIYTKYKVTTVANPAMGIKEKSTGYLHAFTCYYYNATTVPENNKESFLTYEEMMQFINDGLKANNNEGLAFLEKALGLK
ncbi:hypothetical protein [uncultured Dokdonia sp.]|uniref:hypothetical protein n=1 Tax=uncultured Dokdonia sp. TaxID=575653 RepID=UPI002636CBCA|nr:hypothetical protein [uncultured Dokdonia sp.]